GYLICLTLALGWAFAAYVRRREIRQMKESMKSGNSFAFLSHDINDLEHSKQANLPRVTVVMPLKGFGEHNLHNWTTQDDVDAKVVVAGPSTTCSQKIHNQLVGVERMHKDSKYVLFLDDDVRLHPGSIGALTAEMEKNPEIFIQTGYPLDLPSGSLGSYCIYEYHMMHADDFRTDRHGVVSELRDGGYSDDMTLASIAGLLLAGGLAICTVVELLSMWNLTRIEVQLCNMLSPEAPPLSLNTYNWCLVFMAMLVDNGLYPVSAFRSHFSQSINWSGIRYHLKNGKIHKTEAKSPLLPWLNYTTLKQQEFLFSQIERSKGKGPKFTDLGGKHLYGKKGAPPRLSILGSLSRSLAQWRQPKKFDV
ncbi:hypothetical protein RJ639_043217, partial [Escallonia herrerae]